MIIISGLHTQLSWNYRTTALWQYWNRETLDRYSGGEKYIDLNVLNKDKTPEDLIVG